MLKIEEKYVDFSARKLPKEAIERANNSNIIVGAGALFYSIVKLCILETSTDALYAAIGIIVFLGALRCAHLGSCAIARQKDLKITPDILLGPRSE